MIGEVTDTKKLQVYGLNDNLVVNADLSDLRAAWKKTLSAEV
jgi:hypothetical protein